MPSHQERVRRNYQEEKPDNRIQCPVCKSKSITQIHRPEIYEYHFFCKDCQQGFN